MTHLEVEGWEVAQVELERSWSGREPADRCLLFRSPSAWTVVSIDRRVRYGDDEPVSGRAIITVEELAEHVGSAVR